VIENRPTGLLAEQNDASDLADRIRSAIGHPGEIARVGRQLSSAYETRFRGQTPLAALLGAYAWVGAGDGRSERGICIAGRRDTGRYDRT
jgi:hypothetical protein